MAKKKEIDIKITRGTTNKIKVGNIEVLKKNDPVTISTIQTSSPLVFTGTGGVSQPRIVSGNYNEVTDVLTLTRDDGTIINVSIPITSDVQSIYNSLFPSGTLTADDVGGVDSGTNVDNLTGLTISEVFDLIFFPPSNPTASLSGSEVKTLEVGTSISPVLTGTFNQGSAGSLLSISLEKDNVEIATVNPYTDVGLTSVTPDTFVYDMTFTYDADILPAGSITTNNVNYSFIYPIFYGISSDNSIDAADIIAGTKVVSSDTTPTVTFNSTSSDYIWIAVPSSFGTFDSWFVNALNQGAIGTISDLFNAPSVVSVTTVNWSGINYELYVSNFSTESTEPMTFS